MIIIFNWIHFLLHPYLTMSQFLFNHGFSLSKLHSITCMAVLDWIFGNTETIMLLKSEIWHHWLSWIYVVINLFSASSFKVVIYIGRLMYGSQKVFWKLFVKKVLALLFHWFSSPFQNNLVEHIRKFRSSYSSFCVENSR